MVWSPRLGGNTWESVSLCLTLCQAEECESLFSDSSGCQAKLIMIHIFTLNLTFWCSALPSTVFWLEKLKYWTIFGSEELNKTVSAVSNIANLSKASVILMSSPCFYLYIYIFWVSKSQNFWLHHKIFCTTSFHKLFSDW